MTARRPHGYHARILLGALAFCVVLVCLARALVRDIVAGSA